MNEIPGAVLRMPQLDEIKKMLESALSRRMSAEWYTLEQAYVAKYGDPENGPAIETIKRNLALQPRGGVPDGWQQSHKAWRRETIEQWVLVDDTTLADYLAKCAPGMRIPAFIARALDKRPTQAAR